MDIHKNSFKVYEYLWTYAYIKGKEGINLLIYMIETTIKPSTNTPKFGLLDAWKTELAKCLCSALESRGSLSLNQH